MYIESVRNRNSPPCLLLRESYRDGRTIRKRTLANLSGWEPRIVAGLRALLRGTGRVEGDNPQGFDIVRSLPHGHVAAVLGVLHQLGLDCLVGSVPCRERDLVVAMVVARVIDPCSRLATASGLTADTAFTSLGQMLNLGPVDENELYAAMDWLLPRQDRIEKKLAKRHLRHGALVLDDVTSSYFEGRTCPLAQYGQNRDGKESKLQIVFGLLCDAEGRPVAVAVFEGNTADSRTLAAQIQKVRKRFRLHSVVLVGDRGMLTEARLRDDLRGVAGLDWITALRAPAIQSLVREGHLQLSLFAERDLAEITSARYPGERLVVCRNPLLAEDRARTREELLQATEEQLAKIAAAVRREQRPLRGKDRIGLRVGRVINRFKMAKHFRPQIGDRTFVYERQAAAIAEEAALDGFYAIRTSVPAERLDAQQTVGAYKSLSRVERAFRSLKTVDLKVRPIHHHLADRVRAHVFLCMLAYYVEWHMRQALAPLRFDDQDRELAAALRPSVVAPAQSSPAARHKAAAKRTQDGFPVLSFRDLLKSLGTIARHQVQPCLPDAPSFQKTTRPNRHQQHALDLLKLRL
jgi:hypothetical protein